MVMLTSVSGTSSPLPATALQRSRAAAAEAQRMPAASRGPRRAGAGLHAAVACRRQLCRRAAPRAAAQGARLADTIAFRESARVRATSGKQRRGAHVGVPWSGCAKKFRISREELAGCSRA